MSLRDDGTALRQMLQHAEEAVSLVEGLTQPELEKDRVLSLAVVRLLEVTGEAANRVSENRRNEAPQIPWAQIIGLRNRLIHGYDAIDMEVLWQILSADLPVLAIALRELAD